MCSLNLHKWDIKKNKNQILRNVIIHNFIVISNIFLNFKIKLNNRFYLKQQIFNFFFEISPHCMHHNIIILCKLFNIDKYEHLYTQHWIHRTQHILTLCVNVSVLALCVREWIFLSWFWLAKDTKLNLESWKIIRSEEHWESLSTCRVYSS